MTETDECTPRRGWPSWATLLTGLAVAWVLHTVSGISLVGVDNLRFTLHKIEQGFEIWPGWRTLLVIHAGFAALAVAFGAASFVLQHYRKWQVHRWLGTGYVAAVFMSAAASLPLAMTATGGPIAVAGFVVLAFGWGGATGIAFRAARRRDLREHPRWMIRSYALSLANTTLHVVLVPLTGGMGDRAAAYRVAVWLCMAINLLLAELVIRSTARAGFVASATERHAVRE